MEKYVNALEYIGNTDTYTDREKLDFMHGVMMVLALDTKISYSEDRKIKDMYEDLHDTFLGRYLKSLEEQKPL